jgi:hypothetical protein
MWSPHDNRISEMKGHVTGVMGEGINVRRPDIANVARPMSVAGRSKGDSSSGAGKPAGWLILIFSDNRLCCRRRTGCGRRDGEGDPGIPACWPVFRSKLSVSL